MPRVAITTRLSRSKWFPHVLTPEYRMSTLICTRSDGNVMHFIVLHHYTTM